MTSEHSDALAGGLRPIQDLLREYSEQLPDLQDDPTLLDGMPDTPMEALADIQFTLAMMTDRLDYIERVVTSVQQDLRYCMQWIDRDEVA